MTDCNGAFESGVISSLMALSFTIRLSLLFSIMLVVVCLEESAKTQIVSAVNTAAEMAIEMQTLVAVARLFEALIAFVWRLGLRD